MYQKPDFVKVSLKVSDIFANYAATACPEDEFLQWQFTVPCEGTDNWQEVANTYTGMGYAHMCYSTKNP